MFTMKLVTIKPMSFRSFKRKFHTDDPDVYMVYLENNKDRHHYPGFETMEQWHQFYVDFENNRTIRTKIK